jgi:hypothetical protein
MGGYGTAGTATIIQLGGVLTEATGLLTAVVRDSKRSEEQD